MNYRIILTKNGYHKKLFKKRKSKRDIFQEYHELLEENEREVYFPKKYINYNGIIPVQYYLYIVKDKEEGDRNPYIRDEFGRLNEEPPLFDKYTILDKRPYNIEETFWVYGYDKNYERKDIKDIIRLIMEGLKQDEKIIRSVIVVHNKLLIYDQDRFNMVICKCQNDAQRLHHELKEAAFEAGFQKRVIFFGTASKKVRSDMFEIIQEETGWPLSKIHRTTTRP